jgi:hypothetical protein
MSSVGIMVSFGSGRVGFGPMPASAGNFADLAAGREQGEQKRQGERP